ncbi:alanyl-tRNA editing protein [Candidatus Undinarchaeota archaeon]
MTEILYMTDNYIKEFDAEIVETGEDYVILDKTAFYAIGGGQESDQGWLEFDGKKIFVKQVTKKDGVKHFIDGEVPSKGTKVHGILDWDRRYAHMRMHTAQHLISAVGASMYNLDTRGNQIHADRSRVDFYPAHFDEEGLKKLEDETNKKIAENHPVNIFEVSREEAEKKISKVWRGYINRIPSSVKRLRMIDVDGIDCCMCAGTHVANTSEIGRLKIIGKDSKGADIQRISYILEEGQ